MIDKKHLENMAKDIQKMRRLAEDMKETGKGIETIEEMLDCKNIYSNESLLYMINN